MRINVHVYGNDEQGFTAGAEVDMKGETLQATGTHASYDFLAISAALEQLAAQIEKAGWESVH